jgi:Interferon-induced transmembrane protein
MMPGAGGDVNTTTPLILGIVSIFCCWPGAIAAIVFAVQAKNLLGTGDVEGARAKAKLSKTISIVCIGLGIVGIIIQVILTVLSSH